MSDLTKDTFTINMVIKTTTDKYWIDNLHKDMGDPGEISIDKIEQMITDGNFIAELIMPRFTNNSTGTLIITEKE